MDHREISGLISDGYVEVAMSSADIGLRESLAVREPADAFGYARLLIRCSGILGNYDRSLDIGSMLIEAYGTAIPGAGGLLAEMSSAQQLQHDYSGATETLDRALPLLQEPEDRETLSQAQWELGVLHHLQGNLTAAGEQFRGSLATCEEIGNNLGAAHNHRELGVIFGQQGLFDEARDAIYSALWLYHEGGNHTGMAHCMREMGVILRLEDDLPSAEIYLNNALQRFEALDAQPGVADTHAELAVVHLLAGEIEIASQHYVYANELYRDLHNSDGPRVLHGKWDDALQELDADV